MFYDTLQELLNAKFEAVTTHNPVVFVRDEELANCAELLVTTQEGEEVVNPVYLTQRANDLGYWCEADWDEKGGGFNFAPNA